MPSIAEAPPSLNIPSSSSTVNVHIIDSTARIKGIPFSIFTSPQYKGLDYLNCPAFSFLIENSTTGRKVLFDLGVRQDWETGPGAIVKRIKDGGWDIRVEKGVAEILRDGGVDPKDVEAIIWRYFVMASHFHWDHTGDPSTFPASTDLVVGPGFKEALMPGHPTNPNGRISESAYEGRKIQELSFSESNLMLGRCRAIDFFNDGSFYLLDTPGHAIGHMGALCRTTASPSPTFIFLGGDCAHHGGEFRPTPYLPLPSTLDPSPIPHIQRGICPGSLLASAHHLHPSEEAYRQPFLLVSENAAEDVGAARDSVDKMEEFDACEDVLVMLAHDRTLLDVVRLFPDGLANEWKREGWRERGMWRFLEDFRDAVQEKGDGA